MADKILIVGATGLIGGLLTRKLVEQGRDRQLHLLLRRPYREDRDLVGAGASAAKAAGARQFIAISSTMADSSASSFYLKTKGEAEDLLRAQHFDRLDIIRPGLLRGERINDTRLGESLAIAASPLMDLLLHGRFRRFRSILASDVAAAILALIGKEDHGTFVQENDAVWEMV